VNLEAGQRKAVEGARGSCCGCSGLRVGGGQGGGVKVARTGNEEIQKNVPNMYR
jgi:hypothetical protein